MIFLKLVRFFAIHFLLLGFLPLIALAHENYVLPTADITRGMNDWSINVFDALKTPGNLVIILYVGLGALIVFFLYYLFWTSPLGIRLDKRVRKLEPLGHIMLRATLGVFFIASGLFNSFLGPEIPLASIPLGLALKPILFIVGGLLIVGLLSRVLGIIGLALLLLTTFAYGNYMLTYGNYFGELMALALYGSTIFSLDSLIAKQSAFAKKYKKWEIPLIRITYGISILYPAISVKLLHPSIILKIVGTYGLNHINWLFPSDPLLIALGSGLAQVALGLFIIIGFETRLSAFATLILYTLSILFFKEAVWPHYILLALALYLTINNGGGWTVDNWLLKKKNK